MTSTPPASEAQVKTLESGAVVAGGVALVTLVVGLWLGFNAATNTDGTDRYDDTAEYPTLGIGVAIIVLSVAVAALAATMCVVLYRLSQPGRAALREHEVREAERLAAESW